MLYRHGQEQSDPPPPLPPLRGLALGMARTPDDRVTSDDEDLKDTERLGATVRRDVVTREAKLSLTDTMTLLRARGPRRRLDENDATASVTGQAQRQDAHVRLSREPNPNQSAPWVPASRFVAEPVEPPRSSRRHNEEIRRPIQLLTLADTITLPTQTMERPMMVRRLERDDATPYYRGDIPDTNTRADRSQRGGNNSEYPVAGTEWPVRRPWTTVNEYPEPFELSLGNLRRRTSIEEAQLLFPSSSLTNTRLASSAPSTTDTSSVVKHDDAPFIVQDSKCSVQSTSVPIEEKATRPTQGRQDESEFGFSLAETLMLPKPRPRRPGIAPRASPSSSKVKRIDGGVDDFDDDDDDDRPCCLGPEYEIREGMTPEEIRQVKKARRKEQCRVNQANYRRRKRAVELQTDREIQELQQSIEQLEAKRDMARKRARHTQDTDLVLRDPMALVQHIYLRLSPAQEIDRRLARAPARQVDAIVGLEYEEFTSVEELLAQWKYHRTVFETFELRLRSVRSEPVGESLVLSAEATLRCAIVARPHRRFAEYGGADAIVTCPVVQRFVFDDHDHALAKVISEVDWLAGLRAHSASALALAAELVTPLDAS